MHSGSPALPGRSPKFTKLQPVYANFRKSSYRIRNQLKSRIRIRKKMHSGSDQQHCREGHQNVQNYNKTMLILGTVHVRFKTNWKVGSGSGKKCIPDPQHCREGQQNLENYNKIIPWSGTVVASSPASAACACASRPPGWRCSAWNSCPAALKTT